MDLIFPLFKNLKRNLLRHHLSAPAFVQGIALELFLWHLGHLADYRSAFGINHLELREDMSKWIALVLSTKLTAGKFKQFRNKKMQIIILNSVLQEKTTIIMVKD